MSTQRAIHREVWLGEQMKKMSPLLEGQMLFQRGEAWNLIQCKLSASVLVFRQTQTAGRGLGVTSYLTAIYLQLLALTLSIIVYSRALNCCFGSAQRRSVRAE